jgi:RimJ/RimL family protein N-acetyltransferase
VKLLALDRPEVIARVAEWLARKENFQWLDFGGKPVTPALLKIMAQRETHFLRAYTSDLDDEPIGILGLNHVDRAFRSATFWGASGDKAFRSRGYSTFGSSLFLGLAFRELGLRSINTWVVDGNPSARIIERLGFQFIGRLRLCHAIDGQPRDRLLYDLLASEHRELGARWLPKARLLNGPQPAPGVAQGQIDAALQGHR